MGLFSKKTEDYDISSSKLGDDSPDFKTKAGMHHEIHSDNTTKTTYYDSDTNTRVSWRTDTDGNVIEHHPTDQNKPKGDPDRH